METPLETIMTEDVNNHIHTHYSFSPYSPEKAILRAKDAGLSTAGIMDHDTLAGADAFECAGRLHGMATTVGMEVRADFTGTPLSGRHLNNPDQPSIAYIALHGIPRAARKDLEAFLLPYVQARMIRNRIMTRKLHALVEPHDLSLDFERDVIPLSMYEKGGSITERHLLYALSRKLVSRFGGSGELVDFVETSLGVAVSDKARILLESPENAFLSYDLLGVLKSGLMSRFYVPAVAECPDIRSLTNAACKAGAILAYAYLGDVTASVTGDKKPQTFEDSFLDLLFETIVSLGFHAVTYMPSRNTPEQLDRIQRLCQTHDLFQISGEDINSPRQAFVCSAMRAPGFLHLADSAWALIGHEAASEDKSDGGMFSSRTCSLIPALSDRIAHFASLGRAVHE